MSLYVDIVKRLGTFDLRIKFEIGNETLAFLGGSGSGKSMTLKCIAGIEKPDKGKIIVDGVTLFDSEKHINLTPQKRRVGYLFQQYALFPNMTVRQNIRCGCRDKSDEKIIDEMIHTMQLDGLEDRRPDQISGGQQQRTALARILVNDPDVLLLDEPFSALDTQLRFKTEMFVRDIIKDFGKPVIIVSHDRDEVFRISNRIAVINNGQVEAFGQRKDVFRNPVTKYAAVMTGCKNISEFTITDNRHIIATDWGMKLELDQDPEEYKYVGVRRHYVEVGGGENVFDCEVCSAVENPFSYILRLKPLGTEPKELFEIEMEKQLWDKKSSSNIRIHVPKSEILLLKDSGSEYHKQ